MPLYYEQPLELARGEGFKVWDSEGNEYLDFFGGIVTTISGHAVPEITEAIKSQVDEDPAHLDAVPDREPGQASPRSS